LINQARRQPIFRSLRNQRGSILVGVLMLVFVMTILGLALFDIAQLDARLKIDSVTGVRALEIAEAGLERGLHLFYLEFACGGPNPIVTLNPINPANCASPPTPPPNYIVDNNLARIALTTACPAELLPDGAAGFKQLKLNQGFANGTYTVCARPHPDAPTNQLKAQLRSRGVLTSLTGTAVRIVQIDATAIVTANKPHAPFAIGGPTTGAFRGGALIAGSLQFVKCPGAGCVAASFSGNSGIQNNYDGLRASLHDRIPWRYQDGTPVNTLGAVLKVKEGVIELTANSACIGAQESGSGCGSHGNTAFQDTMSGVYTSGTWSGTQGSCGSGLNGATTTNRRCNVWTLAQGPYPVGEPDRIPLLSDSTIIDGNGYFCFFNPPGSTCPNTTEPVPGGTNFPEYFYTGAWRIDDSRGDAGCDIAGPNPILGTTGTAADCTTVLTVLQTGATPDFGTGPVTILPIKPAACTRQGAADSGSCTLRIAAGQLVGVIDGNPIRPDLEPINVYLKRRGAAPVAVPTLKTSPVDAVVDNNMYYQGKIMIIADNPAGTPGFEIDTGLLSAATINQAWCSLGAYLCGYAYPANHFAAMFTTGDIKLGPGPGRDILGSFFAANTGLTAKFFVTGALSNIQVAGTVSAQQFDFTGAGSVPSLYQAPWNLGVIPGAAGPAAGAVLSIISANWIQVQ
jgi:hypothetical protein